VTIIGFPIPDGSFVIVTFCPAPPHRLGYETNNCCRFLYRAYRCVKELKHNNKYIFFQSNTTMFYHLTYWRQVSVIRPSSEHLYIQFKTTIYNPISIVQTTRCTNVSNLFDFGNDTLHVSDGLSIIRNSRLLQQQAYVKQILSVCPTARRKQYLANAICCMYRLETPDYGRKGPSEICRVSFPK
jgi:hypothetical protein